jgi:cytosine/creatinine deaminase
MNHESYMKAAITEAEKGLAEGGIPIGSVLVYRGEIIGRGHNRRVQKGSPILHGEMDALENAGRRNADVYRQSTIYTTLSPCSMCSGAILLYEIPEVVIGENTSFWGEEDLLRSRGVGITVMNNSRCIELMSNFIETRPELWFEDIGTTQCD